MSIVAVARYADSCPPELHPDCPYAVRTGSTASCGQECRTVLTNMIRSGSAAISTGFDAGRQMLSDQALSVEPSRLWSTVSLLVVLEKVARTRAFGADGERNLLRSVHGSTALALLGERGLDQRKLVALSFGRHFRFSIDARIGRSVGKVEGDMARWVEHRKPYSRKKDVGLSEEFRAKVRMWIEQAELPAVIDWTPPTRDQWKSIGNESAADPLEPEYRWFAERLTQTYLKDWSDSSLALEFRYLNEGWRPSEVPNELIEERKISVGAINAELASRRVRGYALDVDAVGALVELARAAIEEDGAPATAASIFRTALTLDPSSQLIANNLGFSLIPVSAAEALVALEGARQMAGPMLLIEVNLAAAHLAMGDNTSALEAAERAFQIGFRSGSRAWLWTLPLTTPPAMTFIDPCTYCCQLALKAAEAKSDETATATWLARLKAHSGPS